MKNRIRFSALNVLAAALLSISQPAWSLGLGDATVQSFLNEPLLVRIDLLTQPSDNLASVTASLASADDYELIGASRESVSVPLRFVVVDREGSPYIQVTSTDQVKDPVLRLIVEVNWSAGRMLREFTLFLDPATYTQPAPPPAVSQQAAPATTPAPVVQTKEDTAVQTSDTAAPATSERAAARRAAVAAGEDYGPVQSGETLWAIASDWSADRGMNLNKVMIAIQRKNPEAFLNNNINLLKKGAILRMPERDEVDSVSLEVANNEVSTQESLFYSRESIVSPTTPLLATESAAPESAASPPDQAEPADQLELVPPSQESAQESAYGFEESEESSETTGSVQALRESLARTEEELINQQQQNSYLEQRISELEAQLAETQQGTLADDDLASMEQRLREERIAQAEEDAATQEDASAEVREMSVPQVATKSSDADEKPWYQGFTAWLLVLLVVVVAIVGWIKSRSSGDEGLTISDLDERDEEALREIKDEAEDVLRVLDSDEAIPTDEVSEPEDDRAVELSADADAPEKSRELDEDAELLDEDSADPEIQLDLARAYISMGDKEAARVILQEVVTNGSEEQQAEAGKMMQEL